MEPFIITLLYLTILLALGVIILTMSRALRIPGIFLLVIAGYMLKLNGYNFFDDTAMLVFASLSLILIMLETTMDIDMAHIMNNFLAMLKFTIGYFFLNGYILTLVVYLIFDVGSTFESFILCFLLSIIMYGVDASVALEFIKNSKKNRVTEMLKIEGILSGPLVVVFAFFVIGLIDSGQFMNDSVIDPLLIIGKQILIAVLVGMGLSFLLYRFMLYFTIEKEMKWLLIVSVGILVFVMGEYFGSNGSLAVALFGILYRGLSKSSFGKEYTKLIAHIFFIIVFILLGMQFDVPDIFMVLKGLLLFGVYLLLRFLCLYLFIKQLDLREIAFMTLNVAKGIEIALVLVIMKLYFSDVDGIHFILTMGFLFFLFSYISSTIVIHYQDFFLAPHKANKSKKKPVSA
ncbi:cation:proton antiporter [Candidatus Woesearchaeota archaeon]|nr:cation:proton antiporter [Candidatus Woesearchaeota archaeon]